MNWKVERSTTSSLKMQIKFKVIMNLINIFRLDLTGILQKVEIIYDF